MTPKSKPKPVIELHPDIFLPLNATDRAALWTKLERKYEKVDGVKNQDWLAIVGAFEHSKLFADANNLAPKLPPALLAPFEPQDQASLIRILHLEYDLMCQKKFPSLFNNEVQVPSVPQYALTLKASKKHGGGILLAHAIPDGVNPRPLSHNLYGTTNPDATSATAILIAAGCNDLFAKKEDSGKAPQAPVAALKDVFHLYVQSATPNGETHTENHYLNSQLAPDFNRRAHLTLARLVPELCTLIEIKNGVDRGSTKLIVALTGNVKRTGIKAAKKAAAIQPLSPPDAGEPVALGYRPPVLAIHDSADAAEPLSLSRTTPLSGYPSRLPPAPPLVTHASRPLHSDPEVKQSHEPQVPSSPSSLGLPAGDDEMQLDREYERDENDGLKSLAAGTKSFAPTNPFFLHDQSMLAMGHGATSSATTPMPPSPPSRQALPNTQQQWHDALFRHQPHGSPSGMRVASASSTTALPSPMPTPKVGVTTARATSGYPGLAAKGTQFKKTKEELFAIRSKEEYAQVIKDGLADVDDVMVVLEEKAEMAKQAAIQKQQKEAAAMALLDTIPDDAL